jgi:hypothetical protein
MDVHLGAFKKNPNGILPFVCNDGTYSNSIQVAKVQLVNTLYFTCNSFDLKFANVLKTFHEFYLYWSLLCKC